MRFIIFNFRIYLPAPLNLMLINLPFFLGLLLTWSSFLSVFILSTYFLFGIYWLFSPPLPDLKYFIFCRANSLYPIHLLPVVWIPSFPLSYHKMYEEADNDCLPPWSRLSNLSLALIKLIRVTYSTRFASHRIDLLRLSTSGDV